MNIDVLTLFPEMFRPVIEGSIIGRAVEKKILNINLTNIRDYTQDKHNRADDYPFGGGGGMVMMADPIFASLESINAEGRRIIYMSPKGKIIDEQKLTELSREKELVILCGHYEGVDQRVLEYWNMEELSIGDYVLTGGELPAMVLIDAVARLVPGVLGNELSALEESLYSGLLEFPQYTKPREYRGMSVPEVLLNGNHKLIDLWRFEESIKLTEERRPELLEKYLKERKSFTKEEKKILEEILKIKA